MDLIKQFGIVLLILFLGEVISYAINFPIPGSVIGMILLFMLLYFNLMKLHRVEKVSAFLLANLSFFFIPPGVKLIASFDLLKGKWLKIIFICFFTTLLVMTTTAYTVNKLMKSGEKDA